MSQPTGRPINVSLRVIADLSQGLYRSPADALKELVSNAYDADSPSVEINFSSDFSSLTVKDIGKGMTIDDFIRVMETIGGSSKRSADSKDEETPSGRPIVGRIGIGMLSVSQIANRLEIHSSVKGSTKGFKGYIEFDQFVSEEARKIKITDLWEKDEEIKIGNYYITESKDLDKEVHFTTLKLIGVKKIITEKLSLEQESDGYPRKLGVDFFKIEELLDWMRWKEVTKNALHEYDRTIFDLCILCPVPYLNKALSIKHGLDTTSNDDEFNSFAKKVNKQTHLKLLVDGIECFKPIVMPHDYDSSYNLFFNLLFMKGLHKRVVKYNDYDLDGNLVQRELNITGYIYFQKRRIWPPEMSGLLIRVRNVAVGQYDSTFLNYRRHEGYKFSQVTGEIYVDNLDAALNIDRSSFRETEPAYVVFRDAIHNYLNKSVFPGIKKYATILRKQIGQDWLNEEMEALVEKFSSIDPEGRDVEFNDSQGKLIERKRNSISVARSIKGNRMKISNEFLRVVLFMEARLSEEMEANERDDMYQELIDWLSNKDGN